MVSEDLKTTEDNATIRTVTQVFSGEKWNQITRIARLRIENRLLNSVKEGEYDSNSQQCLRGGLGTWLGNVFDEMELKDKAISILTEKLSSSDRKGQDYVFTYFLRRLIKFGQIPNGSLLRLFRNGLSSGDKRYYDSLYFEVLVSTDEWGKELQPLLDSFEERPHIDDQDLPF